MYGQWGGCGRSLRCSSFLFLGLGSSRFLFFFSTVAGAFCSGWHPRSRVKAGCQCSVEPANEDTRALWRGS